jgi:thioester reductase-like protein
MMSMCDVPVTLVTGFPNAKASHLVSHLLANGRGEVSVVVSPRDAAETERYAAALPPAFAARFRYYVGEPWAIDMGLAGAEYRELCRAVTCIQHAGMVTGPSFGKEAYDDLIVGSMREALELALAAERLGALIVHSGLVVSGDRQGHVGEAELVAGQRFASPGPAALARAELMARRHMARLPVVVVRSGQVVGPADSGAVDVLEGVYLLILLILNSPQDLSALLADWGDAPVHVVPIDYYVRAVDALSGNPQALGQTVHLTDPQPMTVRVAFNRCMKIRERFIEDEGLVLPSASSALRRDGVLRDSLQAILWRPRTFINMTFRKVRYGTELAERLLGPHGLACPSLESYFEQLVRHVARVAGATSPEKVAGS